MEIIIALTVLAAFGAFLIYRARKPQSPPDYGDQQPPRDATPEEIEEYWRNR